MKKGFQKDKHIENILKPYNEDIKRHIARLVKKSDEDIKRHTGALSEEFKGQVEIVAEQYGDLQKDVSGIKKTLEDHSKIFVSHTEMIGTLLVDMTTVKVDVKSIKESLKTKVSRKKFVELERRVLAE